MPGHRKKRLTASGSYPLCAIRAATFVTPNADETMKGEGTKDQEESSEESPEEIRARPGENWGFLANTSGILRPEWDHVGHAVGIERSKHLRNDAQRERLLDYCAWSMTMGTHLISPPGRKSLSFGDRPRSLGEARAASLLRIRARRRAWSSSHRTR